MIKNEQKAEVARTLFLMSDKTQKEICEIVDWSEKTFTEQKQKGKWSDMKDTRTLTRQQIISLLHNQAFRMVDNARAEQRVLTNKEVDSIAKLASSIDKLEKKATVETYIEVFMEFNHWLLKQNPQLAQLTNEQQDKFIQTKLVKQ